MIGYQERDEVQRAAYRDAHAQHAAAGKTFVYIDESGFAPSATRPYGYAPRGQRVHGLVSGKRRPRTSLLAARVGFAFVMPMLIAGTCNAHVLNAWLAVCLCPKLGPEHVVVMDNASFHKGQATRDLIEAAGATLLFLPPYSPDLNPIEHDFAALKRRREYDEKTSLDVIVAAYTSSWV